MAVTVTAPTATAALAGLKYFVGKLTGTWPGDTAGRASVSILSAFSGNASASFGAYFVIIPPASGIVFQWDVGSITSNFACFGAAASNVGTTLASITYSIDFSSFNCVFNGIATVGLPFIAFGY
jgi:hypothetical protein